MKLTKLSGKLLKFMVSQYKKTGKDIFSFADFKSQFSNYSDDFLSNALYALEHKGYVSVSPGDDVAYSTTLLCDGITAVEENTWFTKALSLLKAVKTLLR